LLGRQIESKVKKNIKDEKNKGEKKIKNYHASSDACSKNL
jgi:hypothetical protein